MKILILLDGSDFAEAVLEPAAELANRAGAEVHLMEVVKPSEAHTIWTKPPPIGRESLLPPYSIGVAVGLAVPKEGVAAETKVQAEERAYQEAEEYLERIAGSFFPKGAVKEVAFGEEPAKEIANYARKHNIDLVALATHGRTGLPRLLFGSVAGSLLRTHVAPLFMVRPDGLGEGTTEADLRSTS